ncbi:MAG: hypothetical protein LBR53_09535 [Deltaproteobacteria bacterium]|jgi:hypothetical protein|nr:hypothetical protein [Deltaproteobacteria bacterium]
MLKSKIFILPLILGLSIVMTACLVGAPKRLNISYAPQAGGSRLTPGTVYLVVHDARSDRSLVGPGALDKNLFKGSQNGQVDLSVILPTGQSVARSLLTVEEVVYEAVKERLRLLGIVANPDNRNAKARVTINVADFVLDASGTNALAHVRLEAVIEGPDTQRVTRGWAEADSSKFKLIGDMGGAESLGEALTLAVNRLNFSSLNNY